MICRFLVSLFCIIIIFCKFYLYFSNELHLLLFVIILCKSYAKIKSLSIQHSYYRTSSEIPISATNIVITSAPYCFSVPKFEKNISKYSKYPPRDEKRLQMKFAILGKVIKLLDCIVLAYDKVSIN